MKQLLKKSLACVVSLALGVTMLAGAVTISRADVTPTITVATVTVEPGATQVNVPVTLAGMNDVAGYSGTVTLDNALTLEGINDASGRFVTSGNNQNTYVNGNTVSFAEVLNGFGAAAVTEMGFTLVVTAPQAEETYPITVTTCFCNIDEQILSVNATNGAVIVEAPVVHEHTYSGYSSDAEGHWQVCTECAESTAKVAHTYDAGVITTQPGHETTGVRTYTCTVCGYQTTEVVGATGHTYSDAWSYDETDHWHDCTANDGAKDALAAHTYDGGVVTTAATSTTPGVMTYTCTVCGRSYTEEIPATAPTVDTSIKHSASILVRDKFGMSIGISRKALNAYDSFYMEVVSQHYKKVNEQMYMLATETDRYTYVADGDTVPEGYSAQVEATSTLIRFEYMDITAYEMSLPVQIVVYCLNDDQVVAVSETWTHSLAERALNKIASASDKSVYMDLVNYGAAVQTYFADSFTTSDLAVSGVLPNVEFASYAGYATSDELASSALVTDASKTTKYNGATVNMATNLIVASNNQLKYTLAPSTYDQEQIRFVITYVDSYGNDNSVTLSISDMEPSGKNFTYTYDRVKLYDTEVTVVASVYEGETLLATREFSFKDWVAKNVGNSSVNPVGHAMMKLNYSVRASLGF